MAANSYDVVFTSALREWSIRVRMTDAWVMLRTFVLCAPESPARRHELLETVMRDNAGLSLVKFSLSEDDAICLELEYRTDDVTSEKLKSLCNLIVRIGDEYYPKLFRLITGDVALDALETAFKKPASEQS